MRYSGGRFRLGAFFEVNRPDVPLPLGLVLATTLCLLPLVALLALDVVQRISPYPELGLDPRESLLLAVSAGVLPMLTVHSISTNRPSSRWLLPALAGGLLALGYRWLDLIGATAGEVALAAGATGFT